MLPGQDSLLARTAVFQTVDISCYALQGVLLAEYFVYQCSDIGYGDEAVDVVGIVKGDGVSATVEVTAETNSLADTQHGGGNAVGECLLKLYVVNKLEILAAVVGTQRKVKSKPFPVFDRSNQVWRFLAALACGKPVSVYLHVGQHLAVNLMPCAAEAQEKLVVRPSAGILAFAAAALLRTEAVLLGVINVSSTKYNYLKIW